MICPVCQTLNAGGDPRDLGCRVCGFEPSEEYRAKADEAADNRRRDLELREDE